MANSASDAYARLRHEIGLAHSALNAPAGEANVPGIVKQILDALKDHLSILDGKVYNELSDLNVYIQQAKQDIAAIRPKDISTNHIPSATDELDAVVGATEDATNKIMDVCDTITVIAGHCTPELNDKLIACTTRIFEACNFQDVTGQRITKVVKTLQHIDGKIHAIVQAMGSEMGTDDEADASIKTAAPISEDMLLNGPQLPQNAINQDEIDRLLAGN